MATRGKKHANAENIYYGDFSGGINLSLPAEALQKNEMQVARNFEFDPSTGAPKLRSGLVLMATLPNNIRSLAPVAGAGSLLVRCTDNKIYKLSEYTLSGQLGAINGDGDLSYAPWGDDDELVLAAGGKLSLFNGSTVSTVTESLAQNDFVFVKAGRVGTVNKASDEISYSGVGDITNWQFASVGETDMWTDADAISMSVGYKDGCKMVCVAPLTSDLMVFKCPQDQPGMGRIYRVTGDYPDWEVQDYSKGSSVCNHASTVTTTNDLLFLTAEGVASLGTVAAYGDIKMNWAGAKVNPRLAKEMDFANCRMWKMATASQVWVRTKPSETVWVYNYGIKDGAWTTFQFPGVVADACCVGDNRYIAIGRQIFRMEESFGTDNGQTYSGQIKMQGLRKLGMLLIKQVYIAYDSMADSVAKMKIEGHEIDLPLGGQLNDIASEDHDIANLDDDPLLSSTSASVRTRLNMRVWDATAEIEVTRGPFKLNAIGLEVAEV